MSSPVASLFRLMSSSCRGSDGFDVSFIIPYYCHDYCDDDDDDDDDDDVIVFKFFPRANTQNSERDPSSYSYTGSQSLATEFNLISRNLRLPREPNTP